MVLSTTVNIYYARPLGNISDRKSEDFKDIFCTIDESRVRKFIGTFQSVEYDNTRYKCQDYTNNQKLNKHLLYEKECKENKSYCEYEYHVYRVTRQAIPHERLC